MLSLPDLNAKHALQRQHSYVLHTAEHLGAAGRGLGGVIRPKDESRGVALARVYDEVDHAVEDASHIAGVGLIAGGAHATYRAVSGVIDRMNKYTPGARAQRGVVELDQAQGAFERALELYDDGSVGYTDRARAVQFIDHARDDARHGLDLLKTQDAVREPLLDELGTLEHVMRDARPLDQSAVTNVRELYAAALPQASA